MSLNFDVYSVNLSDHDIAELARAVDEANRCQSFLRFVLAGTLPNPGVLAASEALYWTFAESALPKSSHSITVTSTRLADNWFSHSNRNASLISTHDWHAFAPPNVTTYLLLEFALAAFIQTCNVLESSLEPHTSDTGCLFDLVAEKASVHWKMRCGYICAYHRDRYMRFGGNTEALNAIEQMLHAVRRTALGLGFSAPAEQPGCDVVVVLAIEDEFTPYKELLAPSYAHAPFPHHRAQVDGRSVALVLQSEMGSIECAGLATRAALALRPRALLMTGIMGGLSKDVALGDVVVSSEVFDYSFGKVESVGEGEDAEDRFLRDLPHRVPKRQAAARAQGWISSDQRDGRSATLATLRAELFGKMQAGLSTTFGSRIHFGRIASGPLVIAAENWKRELQGLKRKLLGVDMEIYGLMHAAHALDIPALALKGISDHADKTKDSPASEDLRQARTFAARASALTGLGLVKAGVMDA